MTVRSKFIVSLMIVGVIAAACREDSGGGKDASGGGSTGGSDAAADCTSLPKVQGPTQACCPSYGIDACGANLFCAAFDGRTVATCYPIGSRGDGESCSADEQCSSQSCNGAAGACRGVAGSACTPVVGCKDALCHDGRCVAPSGGIGTICDEDAQCRAGAECVDGRCGLSNGETCAFSQALVCASRYCMNSGGQAGTCAACTTDGDCGGHFPDSVRCEAGRCLRECKDDKWCSGLTFCNLSLPDCVPYTCVGATATTMGTCR